MSGAIAAALTQTQPAARRLAVAHPPGATTKRIEDIAVGDLVWAWSHRLQRLVPCAVRRLFRRDGQPLLRIEIRAGDELVDHILATTEHPFWVQGKGWTAACELAPGDRLQRIDEGVALPVVGVADAGEAAVFNFEVEGEHNYFVGQQGVLVHNESSRQGGTNGPSGVRARYARNDQLAAQHDVALAAISEYMPISIASNTEFGGLVVKRPDGSYYATKPLIGKEKSIDILASDLGTRPDAPEVPSGHNVVAWWHTHGNGRDPGYRALSQSDARVGARNGIGTYMGSPQGNVKYLKADGSFNRFVAKHLGLAVGGDVEVVGQVRTRATDPEIFIAATDERRPSSPREDPYPGAFEAFGPHLLPMSVDLRKRAMPEPPVRGWGPGHLGRYQHGIFPRKT